MGLGLTKLDIPTAFTTFLTVQKLAPIAQYAQGAVSGTMSVTGTLSTDLMPELASLVGKGEVQTERLVIENMPVFKKLSSALSLDQLASPGLGAVKAGFDLKDGRVYVKPMTMTVAGIGLTASGSSGVDQSVAFDLGLAVPHTSLNASASSAITKLISKANGAGASLPESGVVELMATIGGTFTNPTVSTNFTGMAASVGAAATEAVKQIASNAKAQALEKVDSVSSAAQQKARAEADKLIAAAQVQADSIRSAAKVAADKIRAESNARIDSLVSKATNPVAKLAAQKAGDKLRSEANAQADKVVQEGNTRADALVNQARQKAGVGGGGGGGGTTPP
jgi:cell division septum initiation protein DivIVA